MKLYIKTVIFILVLSGTALWVNIYYSRAAVSEALSAQVTDSAAAAAADGDTPAA